MKKATLATVLALSTCMGSAIAADALLGPDDGPPKCSTWNTDKGNRELYKAWLIGYLSGLVTGQKSDFLKGSEAEQHAAWMDRYCADNPNDLTSVGALKLSRELKRKLGL